MKVYSEQGQFRPLLLWMIPVIISLVVIAGCGQGDPMEGTGGDHQETGEANEEENGIEQPEEEALEENEENRTEDENMKAEENAEGNEEETNEGSESEDAANEEELGEDNLAPIDEEEGTTHTVTLYFSDHDLMENYRVASDVEVSDEGELAVAKAALEAWISGPESEELTNLVPTDVVVEYVEDVDGIAHVSFSNDIQNANLGSSGELFIMEQLAMILEQFGYDQTQILVDGEVEETVLGHMYTAEPYEASNPDEFEWME